jgi:hypothetical protein
MMNLPGGIQTHSNGFGPCPVVALKPMAFEDVAGLVISVKLSGSSGIFWWLLIG